jgi:hypothetical protein
MNKFGYSVMEIRTVNFGESTTGTHCAEKRSIVYLVRAGCTATAVQPDRF